MAKKATPVITYTEILCLAIDNLEGKLNTYRAKAAQFPPDEPIYETLLGMIEPIEKKQNALKQLYKIETGAEYN